MGTKIKQHIPPDECQTMVGRLLRGSFSVSIVSTTPAAAVYLNGENGGASTLECGPSGEKREIAVKIRK